MLLLADTIFAPIAIVVLLGLQYKKLRNPTARFLRRWGILFEVCSFVFCVPFRVCLVLFVVFLCFVLMCSCVFMCVLGLQTTRVLVAISHSGSPYSVRGMCVLVVFIFCVSPSQERRLCFVLSRNLSLILHAARLFRVSSHCCFDQGHEMCL